MEIKFSFKQIVKGTNVKDLLTFVWKYEHVKLMRAANLTNTNLTYNFSLQSNLAASDQTYNQMMKICVFETTHHQNRILLLIIITIIYNITIDQKP